jgi:hypothetical protein
MLTRPLNQSNRAGHEHDDDRAELKSSVELLARIEFTHGEVTPCVDSWAQPLPVDPGKSVEASHIKTESHKEECSDHDRNRKRESKNDVRELEELTITHQATEVRDVKKGSSDD